MLISTLFAAGPKPYTHYYMETMTSSESRQHELAPPQILVTLANTTPSATLVAYGDGTLGIEINGLLWAAESPDPKMRRGKRLPSDVWRYANLVLGNYGHTHAGVIG